ncbi:flagellar biosynthetic protein FliO [Curtobacterium flaccumfaciens]|nr:flagellar biosynthetic protein FliO [Curtobacterium flaccumfaciens]
MDTLVVTLRVALSLGVVLALMWVLHRASRKRFSGKPSGRRAATVEVVGRQGIGGKASVVVVDVEGERLVLGVSEHGVALLTSGQAPAPELTIVTGPVALPVRPAPSADVFGQELALQSDATTSLPAGTDDVTPRDRRDQRRRAAADAPAQPSSAACRAERAAAAGPRSCRSTPGARPRPRCGTGGPGDGGRAAPAGTAGPTRRPRPARPGGRRRVLDAHDHRCARRRRRRTHRPGDPDRPRDR